jgi:hypothetical protein
MAEADAALAAQPAPPADGEVAEMVTWLGNHADDWEEMGLQNWADKCIRIRDLLAQRYPTPVPVAERPWERDGWCDAEGRCWLGAPQDGAADSGWILRKPSERLSYQTVSLPAHALPLPAGEVRA